MGIEVGQKSPADDEIRRMMDGLKQAEDAWKSRVDQDFDCERCTRPTTSGADKPQPGNRPTAKTLAYSLIGKTDQKVAEPTHPFFHTIISFVGASSLFGEHHSMNRRLNFMGARLLFIVGVLSACATGAARAENLTIAGKAVDAGGKAVGGVDVADFWMARADGMKAYQGVTSNDKGEFAIKINYYNRPTAIMAMDKERKHGAIIAVDKKSAGIEVVVKLEPLVRVSGKFFCRELNFKPTWTNVYMTTAEGARLLQNDSREAAFSFALPPGKYKFWAYGTDIKDARQELTLTADEPVLDMKTVEMPATEIAKHKGKAPASRKIFRWRTTRANGCSSISSRTGAGRASWAVCRA
jgi:hypothetical protein